MSEVRAVGLGLLTCLASPGLAWASRLGHAADCASQLPLLSTSVSPGQPPDLHHHHPLPGPASGVSLVAASTRLAVDLFLQLPERGTVPSYSCMLSSLLCVLNNYKAILYLQPAAM